MTTITLKDILTNDNLKAFFNHSFKFFSHFPKTYLHFIKSTLLVAKNCREFSFAKSVFSCPTCSHYTFRPSKRGELSKEQERYIKAWLDKSIKLSDCIGSTNLSRATLYRIKGDMMEG